MPTLPRSSSVSVFVSHVPRGGVSLHVAQEGAKASARLSLTSVTAQDAGNYTCQPESLDPAQVTVFVLQGVLSTENSLLASTFVNS